MYIQFKEVSVENFMSIGNTPIVWDISKYKKVLINGKNGSGKTTLFQALTFALFNRAYAKIKKQNLVNTINEKGTKVSVRFVIGENTYLVERTIKPDSFKIFINGELLKQDAIKSDYQEHLEKHILRMDFKTYSQLVVLASTGYTPFLELKQADRRAFIESFLDIDIFTALNKELKKDADANNKTISESDIRLSGLKSHIKLLKEYVDNYSAVAPVDTTQEKLDAIIDNIKAKYAEYKTQEELISTANQYVPKYSDQKYKEICSKISDIQQQNYLAKNKQETIRQSIEFFDTNPTCPKCSQDVDPSHKDKHLVEYNNELYKIQDTVSKNKTELESLEILREQLEQDKRDDSKQENILRDLMSKLNWMKENLKVLYNTKTELEKVKPVVSTPTNNIQEKKQELLTKVEEYKELNKVYEQALTIKKYYDKMLLSLKDSGAKAEIINDYVPIISKYVNSTLERLNIYLKFELDGEFNETLKSRHRDELQYESYSVGERMRLNVALLWAWKDITKQRTGISTNLLAIDEVLENVDINGFEDFLSLVDSDPELNCIIISHKSGIETMFDKVMEVKKVKGFTQVNIE